LNKDFADDIALTGDSWSSMQETTSTLEEKASKIGLVIKLGKCKVMVTSA